MQNVLVFNSADAPGEIQVHAQGFASNTARLYDVTDPENPVRLAIPPAQWTNEGTSGWAFDLGKDGLFGQRDHFGLRIAQRHRIGTAAS